MGSDLSFSQQCRYSESFFFYMKEKHRCRIVMVEEISQNTLIVHTYHFSSLCQQKYVCFCLDME